MPETNPAMTDSEIYCTIFPALKVNNSNSQHPTKNAIVGTADNACWDSAAIPKDAIAAPVRAAGAASTPNTKSFEVVIKPNKNIGRTEPYRPYCIGKPAICAYPIDIGIETSATIIPPTISFIKFENLFTIKITSIKKKKKKL